MDSISGPVQNPETSQRPSALAEQPDTGETSAQTISIRHGGNGGPPHDAGLAKLLGVSKSWHRRAGLSLIALSVIAGVAFAARHAASTKAASDATLDASQRFSQQTTPLTPLAQQLIAQSSDQSMLTVNGQLTVTNSLVLEPVAKPATGVPGQLYYDQTANQLAYYNGTQFVNLQGGGGVTNNNVTNVSNITNVTNVAGGGGGIAAFGGTAGSIAMFTAANTLGNSLISQSGNNLNVGLGSGAGATNLQGGTSGISINTGASIGASGSITVQSGNSSTAAPGDVTLDTGTGVVGGTLMRQYTFESGTDNMVFYTGSSPSCTQSAAQAHSGTFSLALTGGSAPSCREDVTSLGVPVIPGHRYFVDGWVRAATTSATASVTMNWKNNNTFSTPSTAVDDAAGWTEISTTAVAPAGQTTAYLAFGNDTGGTATHYYDDFTITDISSFSGYTTSLGATNSKAVNIGNMNEVGPTNIQGGGGISLSSGISDINVSGGGIALGGTADSSYSTNGNLLLQGGADPASALGGGITINTRPNAGASGNITIQSGDSSTTASGDVSIDTGLGIVSGTVIRTKTFESSNEHIDAWTGFGTTSVQNCTVARTGSCSLAITGGAFTGTLENNNFPGAPVVPGHHYFVSIWAKAATSGATVGGGVIINGLTYGGATVVDNTNGWTQISATFVAPAGAVQAFASYGFNLGSTQTHYFDDYTLTDLSSSSTVSALNLGATNAQFVTIGNANEIGATSILGGSGINIDGGVSTLSLTGGTINVAASAASSLGTSSGSLTIYAAATSTWGLGAPSAGTGGDLTLHAGSGAGNSDNGGNLLLQGGASVAGAPGSVVVKSNGRNSATAFQVQDIAGTSNLLVADTANTKIGIATTPDALGATLQVKGSATVEAPNGNAYAYSSYGTGDAAWRFAIKASGAMEWGDGSSASDTNLYRSAAGILRTDNSFRVVTDSASAASIQDTLGTPLLTANTASMTVTVQALVVSADLTVNRHIITGGSNPSIGAGAAACTAPTVSLTGTDTAGTITITTGSGCAASGKLATITFASAFGTAPRVVIAPGTASAANLAAFVNNSTVTATSFDLETATTPVSSTTYQWNYWAAQ